MEATDNLRDLIRTLAQDPDATPVCVPCTVLAVDKTAKTISCTPLDDSADLVGVRLQAGDGMGLVAYPRVGSIIIVSFLSKDEAYVSQVSEVESYELTTAAGESLKTLLVDFITEVSNLKVTTNAGASLTVINAPQLLAIKNRITQFFHA